MLRSSGEHEVRSAESIASSPVSPGYSCGPPWGAVLRSCGCSRKLRQAGPDPCPAAAQPLPRRDSPRAPGLWTVRLGTSRLPQTHLCSASPREYPSASQQPQKRHSSPQARLGAALSPAARPRPPNSRPFLGDRPAESSPRSRRAEAAPLAMLGTGSQLPREPQKEKGV